MISRVRVAVQNKERQGVVRAMRITRDHKATIMCDRNGPARDYVPAFLAANITKLLGLTSQSYTVRATSTFLTVELTATSAVQLVVLIAIRAAT